MSRTSIGISEELKDKLRKERLPHESSYGDTIARLLNEDVTSYVTEDRARDIANEQITERVVTEAQR